MRRKLSLVFTLAAWLLATGSQWDLVQTFAWARMFAVNARTMSLVDAVKYTLSPEDRCELCNAVSTAKQHEEAALPGGKAEGKLVLAFEPAPSPVIAVPALGGWMPRESSVCSAGRAAPPLPPPRT